MPWRGGYRMNLSGNEFDVPLEATIRADGSVEFGENDPVTNRFRGTLRVQDGRLAYSRGNDSGILILHESGGKRVLSGTVTMVRGGSTSSYTVRLEALAAR